MLFFWSPHIPSIFMQHLCRHITPFFSPFILVQFSLATPVFRRGLLSRHYPAANDAVSSLPFIALHSIITLWLLFHVENSSLTSVWGALHDFLSIPAGLCLPKCIHTHASPVTRSNVRMEYVVMSFPTAHFSHNRLSLLSSIVACVYMQNMREALDLIGTIITYYFFFFLSFPLGLRSCLTYCINWF